MKNPRIFIAKLTGGGYVPCVPREATDLVIAYEFWDVTRGEELTFAFAVKGLEDGKAFLVQCGAITWKEEFDREALRKANKEHLLTGRKWYEAPYSGSGDGER